MTGAAAKAAFRADYRRRIANLDTAARHHESRTLSDLLEPWARESGFDVVLATLPLPDEPDLTPFLDRWLALGRTVALARTGAHKAMEYVKVEHLRGPWDQRGGGLREPPSEGDRWVPGPRTLCLVPGLAFAIVGNEVHRLGRGGGYFDRWLAAFGPAVFALGTGFSVQEADRVPAENHDWILDGLALGPRLVVPPRNRPPSEREGQW